MIDVRKLANSKKSRRTDWLKVLESARLSLRFCDIDSIEIEKVVLASVTPETFTTFFRLLYQENKMQPGKSSSIKELIETAEKSPFSLEDWLSAIYEFNRWAIANDESTTLKDALEYLNCAVELPDAQLPGQQLASLVFSALEVYGLEKTVKHGARI